jgi:hypothetical protein
MESSSSPNNATSKNHCDDPHMGLNSSTAANCFAMPKTGVSVSRLLLVTRTFQPATAEGIESVDRIIDTYSVPLVVVPPALQAPSKVLVR